MNQLNSLLSNSASPELQMKSNQNSASPDISLQNVDGPTSNLSENVLKQKCSRSDAEIMQTRSYYKKLKEDKAEEVIDNVPLSPKTLSNQPQVVINNVPLSTTSCTTFQNAVINNVRPLSTNVSRISLITRLTAPK